VHRPLIDWFTAEAWDAGALLPSAPVAAAGMIARLDDPNPGRRAQLVLLLGLLAEGRSPAAGHEDATREAVRAGLDRFLELLTGSRGHDDGPLRASLLFLLAHFPEDRRRILGAARSARLDADELTRLERCLQQPTFPDVHATRRLGRGWPSPAACDAVVRAHEHDHGLSHTQGLAPDELGRVWELETMTLLAYSGARAHYAIEGSIR
jgi:hypothetical protein